VTRASLVSAPEALTPDHIVDTFNCGEVELDQWLKRRALANQQSGASRTFVTQANSIVIGYYALAAGSLQHDAAPGSIRRNMPVPIPVAVLGRLAIDQSWQGKGLGEDLLRHAILQVNHAAENLGIRALIVHALSEPARNFYLRHHFQASPIDPMTLIIRIDDIIRNTD
jgi:GNAT superfamily N-acetyltransferase